MTNWKPADPVPERGARPGPFGPSAIGPALDRLLAGLGAPPVDALTAVFDRWSEVAGLPLADHGVPASLERGVLVVRVTEPAWATEWRYRQGEVLRRCDEVLGDGVVASVQVRVGRV